MSVLKWTSSIILSSGLCLTAMNIYPLNLYVQFIGVFGWLIVGYKWNDYSIIFINAVGLLILGSGIIYTWK